MNKNVNSVPKENLRKITLPLEVEQIKEFIENKELFFLVEYSDCKLRGASLHTYVGNLELPCDITFTNVSKEDRFELVKSYMESRSLNPANALRLTVAHLLLQYKGFSDSESFLVNPVLSKDECCEFLEVNSELMERWDTFVSSTMLYQLTSIQTLEETYSFKDLFMTIDDPRYIGTNVVNLFSIPSFMELFFSIPCRSSLYYFKPQFEEYMFRGSNLFNYFCCEENTLILVFNEMLAGRLPADFLENISNE